MKYPSILQSGSRSRGYTLLFSVITATLVLGIAVFILGVSKRQYALSITARDSTFAIYAADSALECAIAAVDAGTVASSTEGGGSGGTIDCNGGVASMPSFSALEDDPPFPKPSIITSKWRQGNVVVRLEDSTCSRVIITTGKSGSLPVTVIDSRGYNYCSGDPIDVTNPRIVERALRFVQFNVW